MVAITLEIPIELYKELEKRSRENHRSLNAEILTRLKMVINNKPFKVEETLIRAKAIRELTAQYVVTDEELNRFKNEGRE